MLYGVGANCEGGFPPHQKTPRWFDIFTAKHLYFKIRCILSILRPSSPEVGLALFLGIDY